MNLETSQGAYEHDKLLNSFQEILTSSNISKFQEIINLLHNGLGERIWNDTKKNDHRVLNIIRLFAENYPQETIFIWHQIYQYLSEKELEKNEKLEMGTLYFWFGDTLRKLGKRNYGKYYLKAYVEDIAFHDDFKNTGASEALKFRCYLGEKGLNLIDEELLTITDNTSLDSLKHHMQGITRGEFERIIVHLENVISLESNDDFFLPVSSLKEIIKKIKPLIKTKDGQKDTRLLEYLCQVLFGSINGFRYKYNERSTLFQLDGLILNSSSHPFLKELGGTIVVEAKQYFYDSSIERNVIDILFMNITRVNASSAFLVASANLTQPAEEEIYHTYLRTGKLIIPISFQDIIDLSESKILFPVLISKKISDIKAKRKIS